MAVRKLGRIERHTNPGSTAAREQGCICPVLDNWHGDPELGRIRGFVIVSGCPLHTLPSERQLSTEETP